MKKIKQYPDMSIEKTLNGIVCGIDEAGRGPLAGPVIAAAVIIPSSIPDHLFHGINDSKKLSKPKREKFFDLIMTEAITGIGQASVEEIDQLNILQATFLAMQRAFNNLRYRPDHAIIDGNQSPSLPCQTKTIIKGDAISLSIAAASIIAKVTRDRIMDQLSMEFTDYGWEKNAGYGTAVHLAALKNKGPTIHHRKTFAPVKEDTPTPLWKRGVGWI